MRFVSRSILKLAVAWAVGGAIVAPFTGCDDPADDMKQTMIDQQQKQADVAKQLPKIPTTQELVSGPQQTIALGPLPLTAKVPSSWRVMVVSGATNLQGWTPGATEVAIQLSSRPTIKKEAMEYTLRGAKKEQSEKPHSVLKVDVRPFGDPASGMQIFERQGVGEPREYTIMDNTGKQHITTEQPFKWTLSVLSPREDAFQVYELNFIGLTKSQYDKDKDFLQGILDTLTYGASAAAATTAPAGLTPPPGTTPLPTTRP